MNEIKLCQLAVDNLIEDKGAWLALKEQDISEREVLTKQLC